MDKTKKQDAIWFVILSYHPDISLLKKNLRFLDAHPVIVVDNSVSTKIAHALREIIVGLNHTLFLSQENNGYAEGMNSGMNAAWERGAGWVILLNDDVHLSTRAVNAMVTQLVHAQPGIAGPFAGFLDAKRWTTKLQSQESKVKSQENESIEYISGSFMAIHRGVDRMLHGFYPPFFLYYEDVDYCLRAKALGFPLISVALPDISHEEGKSIGVGSPHHAYYLARNHLLFVMRQAPLWVKIREIIRMPKTWWEHRVQHDLGGQQGIVDFLLLRFGQRRV